MCITRFCKFKFNRIIIDLNVPEFWLHAGVSIIILVGKPDEQPKKYFLTTIEQTLIIEGFFI